MPVAPNRMTFMSFHFPGESPCSRGKAACLTPRRKLTRMVAFVKDQALNMLADTRLGTSKDRVRCGAGEVFRVHRPNAFDPQRVGLTKPRDQFFLRLVAFRLGSRR